MEICCRCVCELKTVCRFQSNTTFVLWWTSVWLFYGYDTYTGCNQYYWFKQLISFKPNEIESRFEYTLLYQIFNINKQLTVILNSVIFQENSSFEHFSFWNLIEFNWKKSEIFFRWFMNSNVTCKIISQNWI